MSHIIICLAGFLAGAGVSAGTFAFIIVIGIIPRIVRKLKVDNILFIENIVITGVIVGNILSLCNSPLFRIPEILGHLIVVVYGLCTGIFVGCMSVALAEILHTFPVLFRRINLKKGLSAVVYAMAFGKMIGGLLYFLMGYVQTA